MEICEPRLTQIKNLAKIFNTVVQNILDPTFKTINPNGGVVLLKLNNIIEKLEKEYGDISNERLVDYCVCNIYRCYQLDWNIVKGRGIKFWFTDSSIDFYKNTTYRKMHYVDLWLGETSSRKYLVSLINDRKKHPLYKHIYPEYEEFTKKRKFNEEVGYMICGQITMGWTPFSRLCAKCIFVERCKDRTKTIYPELYRIREEEFNEAK